MCCSGAGSGAPQVPLIFISRFIPEDTGELPGILLTKPFTPDVLREAVRQSLSSRALH